MKYKSIWVGGALVVLLAGCSDLGVRVEPTAQPEVSALEVDFGSVTVSDSATRTVTLRNSGRADATGEATIACPGFRIVSGGGAFTLGPGGSRVIVVAFQPTAQGSFACALELGNEFPRVSLAGSGALQAAGAHCTLSKNALDFGPVGVGNFANASFDVSNTGTAPLLIDVVSPCSDFLVSQNGGARSLDPGASLTVTVEFNPLEGGPFTCTLAIGPDCPTVSLTGVATTVSFAQEIQPIFSSRCNSCHVHVHAWNYSTTVNQPYLGTRYLYIAPGDTAQSAIYLRITGQMLPRMPQDGPPYLSPFQISKFRDWILEGALNN